MINLSRPEEIKDLRTVWPHEALDFTPWLSQDDNIALLADAVGLDITVNETESSVGDFKESRILLKKSVPLNDREPWNTQFDWLNDVMLKMKKHSISICKVVIG
jgi:hypothetical protein